MNGLVGIISHRRELSVTQAEADDLVLAYESLRGRATRHDARAGNYARVTKISTDDGPGIDVDDASWAVSIGLVHHTGPLAGAALEDLDGQFALISYDARTDQVVVATDPMGCRAVFVAERDGKTYVSTSALALAKHLQARPSVLGLQIFLRAGYQFGTMTNWEGIERLNPGTCIIFSRDGRQQRTYWRPTVDEAVSRLGFKQTVDHCLEVAIETCRAYLGSRPPTWSDLTGGFDSRLVNILLQRCGVEFQTCTRGDQNEQDVQIARHVASTAGWDWTRLTVPQDWDRLLPDLLPITMGWGDAHLEVFQLSRTMWKHQQTGRTHRSLIGGGGGEIFREDPWKQEFPNAGRSNRVNLDNWIDMRLLKPMNTSILAVDPTAEVRENFRERMTAWTKPYASDLNTTQLGIMFAYKLTTGHFGSFASAADAFLDNQHPLYYKPLFTAAISADYRHRNNGRLLRHMIERLDPRVAAITTTSGTPAASWRITNAYRSVPYYAQLGRKAVVKMLEKASSGRWNGNPEQLDPRVAAARRAGLAFAAGGEDGPLEYANMRSAALYKQAALDELLAGATAATFRDTSVLGRVITVELALRAVGTSVEEGAPYAMAH